MTIYHISQNQAFTGRPDLIVEYEGDPPCLFCNQPVPYEDRGADGPLVCGWCDCGCNRNGKEWTPEENNARHANFARRIKEIREHQ